MASLALGIKFIPASNGTADFVYSSTVQGYIAPNNASFGLVNGKTYRYRAENAALTEFEWGTGVWTSATNTFARTTIYFSSTGAKVSFTAAPLVGVLPFVADILLADNNLSDITSKIAAMDNLSVHGADIASAATLNLDAATGNFVHVTGTVGITAITLTDGRQRTVQFTGALTLTASASLILPNGAASLTTVAGDVAVFVADGTTIRCTDYMSATRTAGQLQLLGTPTTFVPTVTFSGGAGLSSSSPGGVYYQNGKLVYIEAFANVSWSTIPTQIIFALPNSYSVSPYAVNMIGSNYSGSSYGFGFASSTTLTIQPPAGSGSGAQFMIAGTFLVA